MSRYKRPTVRYMIEPGSHVDGWHRFSRDHQDDASAVEAIQAYCARNGLVLDTLFGKPAHSGSTITGTREFLAFIAAQEERPLAERQRRGIVVWSLSRLGRDQNETAYYTALLRRLGYALVSISQPAPPSDIAPIYEAVIRYADQLDLAKISVDVKRAFTMIRQDGYATGGFPPRGFVAIKEQNQAHPTKHGGLPRLNARWVRGGTYEESVALAWRLKVQGESNGAIHEATHIYRAHHCYHDMWKRRCYVEAGYVSEADWLAVQAQMEANKMTNRPEAGQSLPRSIGHPRRQDSPYLLSGLLYCCCGRPMRGLSQPRQRDGVRPPAWRPGPDTISYYVCPGHRTHACPMGKLHAATIEQAVLEIVLGDILTDAHLAGLRARLGAELAAAQDDLSKALAGLYEREGRLDREIANLTTAVSAKPLAPLLEALDQRTQERDQVVAEIRDLEREKRRQNPQIVDDDRWTGLVAWMRRGLGGTPAEARDMLRLLVQRVEVGEGKASISVEYAFGDAEKAALPMEGEPPTSNSTGTPGGVLPKHSQSALHFRLERTWQLAHRGPHSS